MSESNSNVPLSKTVARLVCLQSVSNAWCLMVTVSRLSSQRNSWLCEETLKKSSFLFLAFWTKNSPGVPAILELQMSWIGVSWQMVFKIPCLPQHRWVCCMTSTFVGSLVGMLCPPKKGTLMENLEISGFVQFQSRMKRKCISTMMMEASLLVQQALGAKICSPQLTGARHQKRIWLSGCWLAEICAAEVLTQFCRSPLQQVFAVILPFWYQGLISGIKI